MVKSSFGAASEISNDVILSFSHGHVGERRHRHRHLDVQTPDYQIRSGSQVRVKFFKSSTKHAFAPNHFVKVQSANVAHQATGTLAEIEGYVQPCLRVCGNKWATNARLTRHLRNYISIDVSCQFCNISKSPHTFLTQRMSTVLLRHVLPSTRLATRCLPKANLPWRRTLVTDVVNRTFRCLVKVDVDHARSITTLISC